MAPLEDLQSRDLAWISDFVMQQMVLMLRPMMDHLQETDAACDYAQRMVDRLSMDVSEVRSDLERTNKYMAILRQGMGVQNEGKAVLQRTTEGTARTVKRLDDQMEGLLAVVRSVEDSLGHVSQEARVEKGKQEELLKQVQAQVHTCDDLQVRVERMAKESHAIKDDVLSNEARIEVMQRELRELRRGQLGVAPKLEGDVGRPPPAAQSRGAPAVDQAPWPDKKKLAAYVEPLGAGKGEGGFPGPSAFGDSLGNRSGSSQQSKREGVVRVGSAGALRLHQDGEDACGLNGSTSAGDDSNGVTGGARLPLLAAGSRQGMASRGADAAPRLRFTATLSKPESRGTPS
mmetsp:Transcript_69395/g.136177  ORF Transcript_69395/g.136177 Transcript_69395/m.136177 type:complete len:345 (+) Transcript_69395:74-1108(+)